MGHFVVRSVVSDPGGRINEDTVGYSSGAAWVIDGATGFGMRPLTPFPTDAAWYAAELGDALAMLAANIESPVELLTAAIGRVRERFDAVARVRPAPEEEPHAALVVVRTSSEGQVRYAVLGDCAAIVPTPDGAHLINDPVVGQFDGHFAAAIRDLHRRGITARADVEAHMVPLLLDLRKTMNRPGGYWVAALNPDVPSHAVSGVLHLSAGQSLLLASDGFLRLVDPFGLCSLPELLQIAATDGLPPLLVRLRKQERDDSDGRRFPRLKSHDDATALLLTFVD